jgi:hypothetical protein
LEGLLRTNPRSASRDPFAGIVDGNSRFRQRLQEQAGREQNFDLLQGRLSHIVALF